MPKLDPRQFKPKETNDPDPDLDYTVVESDAFQYIRMFDPAVPPVVIIIPETLSVGFEFYVINARSVLPLGFQMSGGDILYSLSALVDVIPQGYATLHKEEANVWHIQGDLV